MPQSGYDEIAAEYYDDGHMTSRNFDVATRHAIAEWGMPYNGGKVLELGAGRGRATEYLGVARENLVQLDSSQAMFELQEREPCSLKVVADACKIPLASGQFNYVLGFLADPFFGLDCLAESHRMLEPGGSIFFTLPAYDWAITLRGVLLIDSMTTRFRKLETGEEVVLPSLVHTTNKIQEMLEFTKFRNIQIHNHTLPAEHQPVSKDILTPAQASNVSEYELPVITSVRADK